MHRRAWDRNSSLRAGSTPISGARRGHELGTKPTVVLQSLDGHGRDRGYRYAGKIAPPAPPPPRESLGRPVTARARLNGGGGKCPRCDSTRPRRAAAIGLAGLRQPWPLSLRVRVRVPLGSGDACSPSWPRPADSESAETPRRPRPGPGGVRSRPAGRAASRCAEPELEPAASRLAGALHGGVHALRAPSESLRVPPRPSAPPRSPSAVGAARTAAQARPPALGPRGWRPPEWKHP